MHDHRVFGPRNISVSIVFCLLPLFAGAVDAGPASVDAASGLVTLPDFKLEEVITPKMVSDISFISLAKDNKGRLLLGGQRGQSILRITLQDGKVINQERLKLPVTEAMGILYAFDSLYVDGSDGKRFGLFRCRDTAGNDQFNSVEMIREWKGGSGEHGAHAIRQGPDGKLYTVCGNFVEIPSDRLPSSPLRNYQDDRPLPRAEDGNGFGAGKKPPGGFITRMDPDGKNAELYAAGDRNTYDIAFNPDGELLGFDSDMEWDWGLPWYRPIRIFHAPSGADQGFREGSAKWPEYYFDSLPAVVDIGLGCPTGVVFGAGAKFPAKYQKAFYVLDWTYGRLIAAHLTPHGATYDATWENFVAPKGLHGDGTKQPNNMTGVVIGDDGALYFCDGGRSTPAELFRVTYTGHESTAPVDLHDADGADARAMQHKLAAFQGRENPQALEVAWPQLGSNDRFIRYAARLAVESQPLVQWKDKALAETNPDAALTALLALARLGGKDAQPALLMALSKISMPSLTQEQQLDKLRVVEVSLSRDGMPAPALAAQLIAELDPMYPAHSQDMNTELCQILLALHAPDSVDKTMKLLVAAQTQEEQVGYALCLRSITFGWTPETRKQYFTWFLKGHSNPHHSDQVMQWFADAGRPYSDGSSYNGYIAHIHADAVQTLTPDERSLLASEIDAFTPGPMHHKTAKDRKFVKAWTMEDLEPHLPEVSHGRNFDRGEAVFQQAQCIACHRFGNDGGAVGPDLTAVSSRYGRHDILESILLPSKVISEQYMDTIVRLKNKEVINGRVLEETDTTLVIRPNPLKPDERTTVNKSDIELRKLSKLSPMPTGLVDSFTQDEILDLIAYLESAGKPTHPDFKK
jgi:putative heme-binding domain-containing protein